jgi:DNA-binding transcriptional MerR regulator
MSATEPAFLTIGQLADELKLPQHILRYWETKFTQLQPLTRAGNRRYYRAQDAELARQINHLLNVQGYTVKGVQKLLTSGNKAEIPVVESAPQHEPASPPQQTKARPSADLVMQLEKLRDGLKATLSADDMAAARG